MYVCVSVYAYICMNSCTVWRKMSDVMFYYSSPYSLETRFLNKPGSHLYSYSNGTISLWALSVSGVTNSYPNFMLNLNQHSHPLAVNMLIIGLSPQILNCHVLVQWISFLKILCSEKVGICVFNCLK